MYIILPLVFDETRTFLSESSVILLLHKIYTEHKYFQVVTEMVNEYTKLCCISAGIKNECTFILNSRRKLSNYSACTHTHTPGFGDNAKKFFNLIKLAIKRNFRITFDGYSRQSPCGWFYLSRKKFPSTFALHLICLFYFFPPLLLQ